MNSTPSHSGNSQETLSPVIQLSYGVLEVGVSAVESYLRLFLLIFYTDQVGVHAKWAGFAVAAGVLWDAVMDPIVGVLCDKTESRFGKRIPWLIGAAPFFAISVVLMFAIPDGLTEFQKILWLFGSNIAVNTSMAALSIPHLAMGSDITHVGAERTKIYAWRMLMSIVGLFAGIGVPAIWTSIGVAQQSNSLYSSVTLGGIILALSTLTILVFARRSSTAVSSLHNKPSHTDIQSVIAPKVSVMDFFKTKSFIALMVGYGIATFGQGFNSSLALYYYKYFLKFTESQLQFTLLIFMLVLVGSLPFWVTLSKKQPKSKLLSLGIGLLGILTAVSYPYLPSERVDLAVIVGALGGISLGCIALFESHLTDLMSNFGLDDSHNGKIFGLWKFLAKSARAASIALSGSILSLLGYMSGVEPSSQVSYSIALVFGPGVGFFFLLGAISLYYSNDRIKNIL